ncbi:MAG TPA: pitrilysin family protein [Caldilineaceae bacterium]|nr:pitrilysin family protein [Caldilineaceae bacterium]
MTSNALPNADTVARVVLHNGLTVLVRENHSAPVVVAEGYIPAGSIHESAENAGLSSFVASMLTRGSARYTFDEFNETVEALGASLGAGSDNHYTSFSTTSLSEDFPQMMQVLSDVVRNPLFPEEQVERVRRQKLVRLQERAQDTNRMAALRFYETIYGHHPYGRAVSGYTESIRALTRDELVTYHADYYTPNGTILVVVGDVDTQQVLDLIHAQFGTWAGAPADQTIPPIVAMERQQVLHPMADKFQADLVIGTLAIPRKHPDYFATRVANTILGQFGMMGRLGETVREEQGLAYYSYSSIDSELHAGVWLAQAGVNPAHVEQATESILAEFKRIGEEPVSAEELADTQAYLTGVVPLTLETNAGVASTLLNMEWYQLGLDYLERYPDLIYGITVEDVQRVAAQYIDPEQCTIVVAGPTAEE